MAAHHIAVYNGKRVSMDYISNPKEEFKFACMRIQDNIKAGDKGIVITPTGRIYEIRSGSRTAKLIKSS